MIQVAIKHEVVKTMKKSAIILALLSLAACNSPTHEAEEAAKLAYSLCDEKVNSHLFHSVVDYTKCQNAARDKYFKDIKTPYIDLIYLEDLYYIKLAEKVDKKQLSINDFLIKKIEYHNYIIQEATKRTYGNYYNAAQSLSNDDADYKKSKNNAIVTSPYNNEKQVYSPSECIGAIVNGECHGSILPNTAYHQTCHGEMLNGQCTGPLF